MSALEAILWSQVHLCGALGSREPRLPVAATMAVAGERGRGGEIRTPGLLLPKPLTTRNAGFTSTFALTIEQ